MNYIFAFALGLGFAAGLRSLTPPAVVAWAAHLGWLNLNNSPLAFMGSIITAVIFSILALFELFADLQPTTPKRTAPFPLVARILTGGLCGACLCAASNQSLIIGAILGAVGGVIGAFAGYQIRKKLVAALNIQRHFHRPAGRPGHGWTRLFLCLTLTTVCVCACKPATLVRRFWPRNWRTGSDSNKDWHRSRNSLASAKNCSTCLTTCNDKEEMTWTHQSQH